MTRSVLTIALVACACGTGGEGGALPFPEDYAEAYAEVRDCRKSGDHDLRHIRVLAGPEAEEAYTTRAGGFPVGAVIVKEEYGFADDTCSGPIEQWTVMVRQPEGTSPDNMDWHWVRMDQDQRVTGDDLPRCAGCHSSCVDPDGYLGTCAEP